MNEESVPKAIDEAVPFFLNFAKEVLSFAKKKMVCLNENSNNFLYHSLLYRDLVSPKALMCVPFISLALKIYKTGAMGDYFGFDVSPSFTEKTMKELYAELNFPPNEDQIASGVIEKLFTIIEAATKDFQREDIIDYDPLIEKFKEYAQEWSTGRYRYRVYIPLTGVRFFKDCPKFHDYKVEPLPDSVQNNLKNKAFKNWGPTPKPKWALVIDDVCMEPDGSTFKSIRKDAEAIVSSLRLHKQGQIGSLGIFSEKLLKQSSLKNEDWTLTDMNLRIAEDIDEEDSVHFEKTDVEDSLCLLQHLKKIDINVPLSRYNLSFFRESEEDKIIDLCICLEASLLAGIEDELSFRLATRGATLLRDREDPPFVFSFLRKVYDVRSKVVHEGFKLDNPKLKLANLQDYQINRSNFVPELARLTGDILKAFIYRMTAEKKTIQDIAKELDNEMVREIKTESVQRA